MSHLSGTGTQIATIIHRDGPMTSDEVAIKLSAGMRTTNIRQGIESMVRNGGLIESGGLLELSAATFEKMEILAERKRIADLIGVTPSRLVYSSGVFNGAKFYADALSRLDRSAHFATVGGSEVMPVVEAE